MPMSSPTTLRMSSQACLPACSSDFALALCCFVNQFAVLILQERGMLSTDGVWYSSLGVDEPLLSPSALVWPFAAAKLKVCGLAGDEGLRLSETSPRSTSFVCRFVFSFAGLNLSWHQGLYGLRFWRHVTSQPCWPGCSRGYHSRCCPHTLDLHVIRVGRVCNIPWPKSTSTQSLSSIGMLAITRCVQLTQVNAALREV